MASFWALILQQPWLWNRHGPTKKTWWLGWSQSKEFVVWCVAWVWTTSKVRWCLRKRHGSFSQILSQNRWEGSLISFPSIVYSDVALWKWKCHVSIHRLYGMYIQIYHGKTILAIGGNVDGKYLHIKNFLYSLFFGQTTPTKIKMKAEP